MSRIKALVVFTVLIMLVIFLFGLSMKTIYSKPMFHYERVYSETFTMPQNSSAYRSITLNQSGSYEIIVNTPDDYTILSGSLTTDSLAKWQNGQFNVSWDGNLYGSGSNMFGLSGPCKTYYAGVSESQLPFAQNMVFWNPDIISKQVGLYAYRGGYEIDNSSLSMGNLLFASGMAGLGALGLFYAVKNRHSIKVTRKKALALIVSLIILVSGGFLASIYSNPIEAQKIISKGTVDVSANDYYPLPCYVEKDGGYILEFDVDKGSIQLFHSGDNSTISHWSNGTEFDIRNTNPPIINSPSGQIGCSFGTAGNPYTQYYILSNTDDYSKEVTYEFTYHWTYNNYFAMIAGIAFAIFGLIAFPVIMLKGKLGNFNSALDNKE